MTKQQSVMKTLNPYPLTVTGDPSNEVVPCHDYIIWQKGADARDHDYSNLIDKIIDIYKDLDSIRNRELKRERKVKRGKSP